MTNRAYKIKKKREVWRRKRKEVGGTATMTSRAYRKEREGVGRVEEGMGGTCHNDKPGL